LARHRRNFSGPRFDHRDASVRGDWTAASFGCAAILKPGEISKPRTSIHGQFEAQELDTFSDLIDIIDGGIHKTTAGGARGHIIVQ
jgi:hypothetical protein